MTPRPGAAAEVGRASTGAHHGEVLQGAFRDADGNLVTGLVSLPLRSLGSTASFVPGPYPLVVHPAWKVKALRAARATLDRLGHDRGGSLRVGGGLPVGRGFGSSTADVVSAIRAVAAALRQPISADCTARIAVAAEGASDGVMFGHRAVLFASREGRVLHDLEGPLPAVELLGFEDGDRIDTLALPPPRYSTQELGRFEALRGRVQEAVRGASPALLAEVATESARINQQHRPKAAFDLVTEVARTTAALGVQTAHTGSLLAVLYDPADPDLERRITHATCLLRQRGITRLRRFRATAEAAPR